MRHDSDITRQIPLVADSGTRPGRDCPDLTVLAAYAESTLGDAGRTVLESHLADCGYCLGQVGFLVREAGKEQPAVPSHLLDAVQASQAGWRRWLPRPALTALAAAASVLLLVAVGTRIDWSGQADPAGAPAAQGAEHRIVRNGSVPSSRPQILEPREGDSIGPAEAAIAWQETPQALQYTVLLVDLQGDVIWEGHAAETRTRIPAAGLVPGQRYFVWVEAHLRDGGSLKSSPVGFLVAAD
jgi:hypothetical protein